MTTTEQQLKSLWERQVQLANNIEQLEAIMSDLINRSVRLSHVIYDATESLGRLIIDNHTELVVQRARLDRLEGVGK